MTLSSRSSAAPQTTRGPGRPPKHIDRARLVDVIEELFASGGVDEVTIENAAREMAVSRATLYRSVPTKEHLLALLFERMTSELGLAARIAVSAADVTPRDRLCGLIAVHISAAVRMRHYLFVFFQGSQLPPETADHWRRWRQDYEQLWQEAVIDAAEAGVIRADDPIVATRLILGMCIWVSRWYRPDRDPPAERLAAMTIDLIDRSGN